MIEQKDLWMWLQHNFHGSCLSERAEELCIEFLKEYIYFGFAHGGGIAEKNILKTYSIDVIEELLKENMIQKKTQDNINVYELTISFKKFLIEQKNLIDRWTQQLGTSLLCDKELKRVYGMETHKVDQLIQAAHSKLHDNFQKNISICQNKDERFQ